MPPPKADPPLAEKNLFLKQILRSAQDDNLEFAELKLLVT